MLILLPITSALAAEKPQIKLIQGKRDRGFDYLDIYTTGSVLAKGLLLEDQLLIDFPGANISNNLEVSKKYLKNSKRIKNITAKQVDAKTARIIVHLKKNIDYDIVNVFGRNKSVVEISDRFDRAERIMAAWEKENLQAKGQELKPYKYKAETKGNDRPLRGKVIVIDPGHGGRDPGATSANGTPEKHLTLAVAQKTAHLLNSAGATVYLTRKEDRTSNLKDIVDFANKIKADIFISIHYNFADKSSIAGTETYYYNSNSRGLALAMHRTLINGIKRKDRGLRKAMYYAVHHTEMPAILLEPAYISNWEESKLAGSPSFQSELAKAIVRGVKSYFRSRSG
ncbi:MAG: N-acetylmuramoyl-L-alanine amidase [Candidatus Margulisiibacteriota bacterium]